MLKKLIAVIIFKEKSYFSLCLKPRYASIIPALGEEKVGWGFDTVRGSTQALPGRAHGTRAAAALRGLWVGSREGAELSTAFTLLTLHCDASLAKHTHS